MLTRNFFGVLLSLLAAFLVALGLLWLQDWASQPQEPVGVSAMVHSR